MLAINYTLGAFNVSFKSISRQPGALKQEVDTTLQLIAETSTRPLAVAFSGGIDSEVICRSLLEQQIPFAVFIMKFCDDYNSADISCAFDFCSQHDIAPIVLDVDILDFMAHGTRSYVTQGYQSHEVFRYLQLWLMEQADAQGYSLIMGGREEPITCHENIPVVRYDPGHLMSHHWNSNHGNQHYPSFFECTPELLAAYLDSPVLKVVCQDAGYFVSNAMGFSPEKILVLHQQWPNMKRRFKMNGFEHLHAIKNKHQQILRLRMPHLTNLYIPVAHIRQQLGLSNLPKIV